jgi:hypothetical protein
MADDTMQAALLVRLGLDVGSRPTADPEYAELLALFRDDPAFRSKVNAVAGGLGLSVLDANTSVGLVLSADETSPLAVTGADLKRDLKWNSARERMVYGVAFAGAAAWCYPNSQAVASRTARTGTGVDVDRLVREHGARLAAGDVMLEDGLSEAWTAFEDTKQVEVTGTGKLSRHCTVKMCDLALRTLADHGLMMEDRTATPPRDGIAVFRPTDRFRLLVGRTGGPLAWQALAHSGVPDDVVASATDDVEVDA